MAKRWMLLLAILLLVAQPMQAASSGRVETVQVSIVSERPLAQVLQTRLENSLSAVTQQMLNGKPVEDVELQRVKYERTLQEVFNRVLFGYEVEWVRLQPETNLSVQMKVTPWGDLVDSLIVQFEYGSLPPDLQPLLAKDLAGLADGLTELFVGLPVDSEDWAAGVARTEIRERALARLPEYAVNMELLPGTHSVLKLTTVPHGPLIQDSRINIRSPNLPNLLLLDLKRELAEEVTSWRSLPAAWVERHQDYFAQRLLHKAQQSALTARYDLTYQVQLQPGALTEIWLTANTSGYKINVEGYLDMGRQDNSTSAHLHAGRMMNRQTELFGEVDFYPAKFNWKFSGGLGRHIGADTDLGYQYQLTDGQGKLWLKQSLAPDWQLRLERYPKSGDYEMGVRYRLHEFLSVEYVYTKQENWLRLIGVL